MDSEKLKKGNKECETLSGDTGLKDMLQFLKEQSEKIERLGLDLNVIQEVLDSFFNTHKCLLKSGVEIQKRLESHPTSRKMGIFRRHRPASMVVTPKIESKVEKREALSNGLQRKGRVAHRPAMLRPPGARPLKKLSEAQAI